MEAWSLAAAIVYWVISSINGHEKVKLAVDHTTSGCDNSGERCACYVRNDTGAAGSFAIGYLSGW